MKHAYAFTLARRAAVATMDLSAENLHLLHTDHWLSGERNVRVLRVSAPSLGTPGGAAVPLTSNVDEMMGWTAKTAIGFLEQADLRGPAARLFANGVNGAGLAGLTEAGLVGGLRVTPFVARKVVAARGKFLRV